MLAYRRLWAISAVSTYVMSAPAGLLVVRIPYWANLVTARDAQGLSVRLERLSDG